MPSNFIAEIMQYTNTLYFSTFVGSIFLSFVLLKSEVPVSPECIYINQPSGICAFLYQRLRAKLPCCLMTL